TRIATEISRSHVKDYQQCSPVEYHSRMSNSANFSGLRVAAFEGRRTADLAELIRKHGGEPLVTPAMREVAPARNPEAIDFANRVVTGQVDVIIFNTGGGVRRLVEQTERH